MRKDAPVGRKQSCFIGNDSLKDDGLTLEGTEHLPRMISFARAGAPFSL